jgi:hypothetical protein
MKFKLCSIAAFVALLFSVNEVTAADPIKIGINPGYGMTIISHIPR